MTKETDRTGKTRLVRRAWSWVARRPWRAALIAASAALVALGWFATWRLDREIRGVLEAPALAAPSLVYSEPVRLYPGLARSPDDLESLLQDLAYERQKGAPTPGTYNVVGPVFQVNLRALELPGRQRPPLTVTVHFGDRWSSIDRLTGPDGEELAEVETEAPQIGAFYGPRRVARDPVRLADVPPILRDAVMLVEDRRFYEHGGLDLKGIVRALTADVKAGETVQGGSTITQQLAKNLFLTRRKTWRRKALEALYALRIDRLYSKDRILEAYLNEVFLGADKSLQISGVAEASRHYFGVDVRHVTLPQAALLAGLIRGPGNYDPFRKPDAALERRRQVLDQLLAARRITPAERDEADAAPLELRKNRARLAPGASAYVDALEAQLTRDDPVRALSTAGLKIYAPLDPTVQSAAQEAVDAGLEELEGRRSLASGSLQGALVVLDPETGAVKALVGGRGGLPGTFNRAVQAKRQPGSLMKPFVYAAALATGRITLASLLADEPIELPGRDGPWKPGNADGIFRGPVTVRRALEDSLNVPSVRLLQQVGYGAPLDVARRCGITSPLVKDYSIVLGTSEVTPLEMAQAFATFAAGGVATPPRFATAILAPSGRLLADAPGRRTQAVSPAVAFLVNEMLRGACRRGTAYALSGLSWKYPIAGKTGTTSGGRDGWFVGYTPRFLALVWVGPDAPQDLRLSGANAAIPIWKRLVASLPGALEGTEPQPPPGVVRLAVDPRSGLRASRACGGGVEEWFVEGTEPTEVCPHRFAPARASEAAPDAVDPAAAPADGVPPPLD